MCEALIGLGGVVIGVLGTLLTTHWSNRSNDKIQLRSERFDLSNTIMQISGEFCSLVRELYITSQDLKEAKVKKEALTADYGEYDLEISLLQEKIQQVYSKTTPLIIQVEIMFEIYPELKGAIPLFKELQKEGPYSNKTYDEFRLCLENFKKEIAQIFKEFRNPTKKGKR